MIKSTVLCAWAFLAVTSLATGYALIPISKNIPEKTECPLLKSELKKLEELIFKKFDADKMLVGSFTELWSTQFVTKVIPYCLKNYVKRSVENDMLQQITVIKNVNTQDQREVIHYLEKIEQNVFLVRQSGTMKPIARIYILYADDNAIATFQCALEPVSPFKHMLDYMAGHKEPEAHEMPKEEILPKMAVIAVPQSSIKFPLPESVQKPLDEAWGIISSNEALFGNPGKTEPCTLEPGDVETNQVRPIG